jgi:hypothetical protein
MVIATTAIGCFTPFSPPQRLDPARVGKTVDDAVRGT